MRAGAETKICWYSPWFVAKQSNYCQILQNAGYEVLLARSDTHFDTSHAVFAPNILLDKQVGKVRKLFEARNRFKQIAPFNPDIILFDIPFRVPELLLGIALARRFSFVTVIHDAIAHDAAHEVGGMVRLLRRVMIKTSKGIVCFSKNAAGSLAELHPDKPVYAVPLLPSLPPKQEEVFFEERRNFAMIGRWSEYKGFDLGLAIWEKYTSENDTDSCLDMWCSGLESPLETPENVTWRSFKRYTWDDFDQALCTYKAVLMPYRSASQSGVQILAWDVGVATLIANLPGLKELQPSCLPAIDVSNVDAWVEALRTLDAPDTAIRTGRAGMKESQAMRSDLSVLSALELCFKGVIDADYRE